MSFVTHRPFVYRVLLPEEWRHMLATECFAGNAADIRDGYIHLSARDQVTHTIKRHFNGVDDLVVVEIDADMIATQLRWEVSRNDELFPHLYGKLPLAAVVRRIPTIKAAPSP